MSGDNFDFHAKHAFLTYPQCSIPAGDALADLTALTGERAAYIVVAHELHEDGGDHLHALVAFKVSAVTILVMRRISNMVATLTAKVQNSERTILRSTQRRTRISSQHPVGKEPCRGLQLCHERGRLRRVGQ